MSLKSKTRLRYQRILWVFLFIILSFTGYAALQTVFQEKAGLLVHSPAPLQAEGNLKAFETWETPISGFFVRSHFGEPQITPDIENQWLLVIDGLVDHPLRLTLADIKKLEKASFHAILECSGNGRSLQKPSAPGVQWKKGAVGNAEWGGTSLSQILKKAGVQSQARFARLEGADKPILPTVPGFVRSVPVEKILEPSTLLAWTMNRQPMPVAHGGPLRLILPGWYGENWIKWITHITFTDQEDQGFYMKKGYRYPKTPVKPGEPWDSAQGKTIDRILVQSFITSPISGQTFQGKLTQTLRGKAFSGEATITQVEISTDEGKNWNYAQLEAPKAPANFSGPVSGTWQEFTYALNVQATPGQTITLMSRATDSLGNVQPMQPDWNPGGYARNCVDQVQIKAEPANIKVASHSSPSPLTGKDLISERCILCHSRAMVESQRITPQQWEGVVKKMLSFGANLSPDEHKEILKQLEQYSPQLPPKEPEPFKVATKTADHAVPKGDPKKGAGLFTQFCAACHGTQAEGKIGPNLKGRAISQEDFWGRVRTGKGMMPPFATILRPQDISDLYSHLQGK